MRKKITIILSLIMICSGAVLVYAANIKIDADQDLVDRWKALDGSSDAELTAAVNAFMAEELAKANQAAMQQQYTDVGTYVSSVWKTGNEAELDRIHGCVFP